MLCSVSTGVDDGRQASLLMRLSQPDEQKTVSAGIQSTGEQCAKRFNAEDSFITLLLFHWNGMVWPSIQFEPF